MSKGLNRVQLIGNVGADPEFRELGGGAVVCTLSLATSRSWTDKNGDRQEHTEWHRLKFWDKLAEIANEYVRKGDRLYVDGEIQYSQSESDDGTVRFWTDIRVREMIMLGGPNASERAAAPAPTPERKSASKSAPRKRR